MKRNEFDQLMDRLDDIAGKLDEVRTRSIPHLDNAVSGFRTEIDALKKSQTWSTRIYTLAGGAIAVLISKFTGGSN